MKIEEALQKLERLELQDFGKKRKFELKESEVAYITVSNELDKYRDRIHQLINEVTIKDAEIERLKEYEHMYKDLCNKGDNQMTREESIKLLKNVVEDFKEEKEFVGKDLIEAIECLLKELDKNN